MKSLKIIFLALLFLWFGISGASAAEINLFDYGFNIDGTVSVPTMGDPVPGVADISGFDDITGLGSISMTIIGVGAHYAVLFVDHEIDESVNTYYNENGSATGVAAAGQSWEIDEPGFVFGDIFLNFMASTLDNTNDVPAGFEDDVSMALGWDFTLVAGETAMIDFLLSTMAPNGFYLSHTDPDSAASIHFSSSLNITGGGPDPIPEPTTLLLVGIGLVGLAGFGRKKFRKQS